MSRADERKASLLDNIEKSYVVLVLILIGYTIIMPSGYLGIVNIKILISAVIVLLYLLLFFTEQKGRASQVDKLFLLVAFLLFGYTTLGIYNGNEFSSIASHLKAIFSMLLIWHSLSVVITKNYLSSQRVLSFILCSVIAYCVIKIILSILVVNGFFVGHQLQEFFLEFFRVRLIQSGHGFFHRLNVPNDMLLPISLFLLLSEFGRNLISSNLLRNIGIFLLLLALFLSFSRYLWLVTVLAIVLSFCKSISFRYLATYSVAILVAGVIVYTVIQSSESLTSLVELRFKGQYAKDSDQIRADMFSGLLAEVKENIWLGKGVGGVVPSYIRFPESPWNYELQWLAIFMNFGIVGLIAIFLVNFELIRQTNVEKSLANQKLLIMYAGWLAVGLVNSFLISSNAAIVFAVYFISLRTDTKLVDEDI